MPDGGPSPLALFAQSIQEHLGALSRTVSGPAFQPGLPGEPQPTRRVQGFEFQPDLQPDAIPGLSPNGGPIPIGPAPHAGRFGYAPTWKWVAPPGVGDAPQMVYETYWLVAGSLKGPGDNPYEMRSSRQPTPMAYGYAATLFGRPIDAGSYLYRALSSYSPVVPPPGLGLLQ